MPIHCGLDIRALSAEEFQELDYRVMGHAFQSQNELGRLCDECVYQRDLQARLLADGFQCVRIEEPITVSYADFAKTYSLDLVADHAVYELKAVAGVNVQHQAQLLNYLFLLGIPRGKLINFRAAKVEGRIHATGLTWQERFQFRIDTHRWQDLSNHCTILRQTMHDLLRDWGAFLDFELYQQALSHFCGGESLVLQRLQLYRDGIPLGTQRFHVHAPKIAFRVTAVNRLVEAMVDDPRTVQQDGDVTVDKGDVGSLPSAGRLARILRRLNTAAHATFDSRAGSLRSQGEVDLVRTFLNRLLQLGLGVIPSRYPGVLARVVIAGAGRRNPHRVLAHDGTFGVSGEIQFEMPRCVRNAEGCRALGGRELNARTLHGRTVQRHGAFDGAQILAAATTGDDPRKN